MARLAAGVARSWDALAAGGEAAHDSRAERTCQSAASTSTTATTMKSSMPCLPSAQAAVASARTEATWAIHSSDGTRLPLL